MFFFLASRVLSRIASRRTESIGFSFRAAPTPRARVRVVRTLDWLSCSAKRVTGKVGLREYKYELAAHTPQIRVRNDYHPRCPVVHTQRETSRQSRSYNW